MRESFCVHYLHCRNLHFAEDCANPYSVQNGPLRENSHANIWAIIFHLLLPQRTSTVAEQRGLFYRDLEQADD